MKIVFLGSGGFAVPTLERLHQLSSRHSLLRVVTRPDRPAGRGKPLRPTPVRQRAEELGLACDAPSSANDPEYLPELQKLAADLFLVADYGEFLRKPIREFGSVGMFNLHGSLLPRHRGAAPVAYAILRGDETTGVTLFRIVRELDGGPMVDALSTKIDPNETAGELENRLALLAADLTERNLDKFASGEFVEEPQDETKNTHASKLDKKEAAIDWRAPTAEIARAVRAYNPWPGAYSFLQRAQLAPERAVCWAAREVVESVESSSLRPGEVYVAEKRHLYVRCGDGWLEVTHVQRPGKAATPAADYLNGTRLQTGDVFGGVEREESTR